jgi:hypothetical protein
MTYELAKQLRDAGYPFVEFSVREYAGERYGQGIEIDGSTYHLPTLSELISALGDKFGVLERFKDGTYGSYYPNDIGTSGLGDTPEEAVANLWLQVNALPNE